MHTVYRTPAIGVTPRPAGELEADLLVIPVFDDDDLADEKGLDEASGGEIGRARGRGEFRGKPFEVLVTGVAASGWKTTRAALIGAGRPRDFTTDSLRRIAIVGGLAARQRRLTRIAILHRAVAGAAAGCLDADNAAQVLAEGA